MTRSHAHITVAKLAVEMAQAVYERLATDNAWYQANSNRNSWVRAAAPQFILDARATLTDMLSSPTISEREKEQIFDALLDDDALPRSGTSIAH